MGRGRVFTGEQAKEKGLVDALGGFDEALAEARALAGLKPEAPVNLVFYPKRHSLWDRLFDRGDDAGALDAHSWIYCRFWFRRILALCQHSRR